MFEKKIGNGKGLMQRVKYQIDQKLNIKKILLNYLINRFLIIYNKKYIKLLV